MMEAPPPLNLPNQATVLKRKRRLEASLKRAKEDVLYLATKILDYNLFTEQWHGPICSWLNELLDHRKVALFAPRKSYKSTLQIAEIIREILIDPSVTILLVHHKLDFARELVEEVGHHLQHNKKLRELIEVQYRPRTSYSNWVKRTNGGEFTIPGRVHKRHPTLRGASCGQDLTGQHPEIIFMDDIISAKTVDEMGGVTGIRQWIEHTVTPLVGTTGKLRIRGTMWSSDDYYTDLQAVGSDWTWRTHAILETDGKPDWEGQPIKIYVEDKGKKSGRRLLTMEDVLELKRESKSNFPGQYMNDPRPKGSRPWQVDKEDILVTFNEVKKYLSKVAVLMDPAPLGMDERGKLQNVHGNKDYWAIAVIGYLRNRKKTVRVLLDGAMSQGWTLDQGLNEAKRLMRKWNSKIIGIEELRGTSEDFYGRAMREKFTRGESVMGFRCRTIKFASTLKGKPPRIMDLCAMAGNTDENGDHDPLFLVNKDHRMNSEFLDMFFNQIENWSGKDSIAHEDVIDAAAYCDDPALMDVIRVSQVYQEWLYDDKPQHVPMPARRSRYCPV